VTSIQFTITTTRLVRENPKTNRLYLLRLRLLPFTLYYFLNQKNYQAEFKIILSKILSHEHGMIRFSCFSLKIQKVCGRMIISMQSDVNIP